MAHRIAGSARKFILNADDFGLHVSINEAVEKAHTRGILKSASLVVNGDAFEEAMAIAKRNRSLGVGIHLALVGERPVLAPGKIPSLAGKDGKLPSGYMELCMGMVSGRVGIDDIVAECEAQILKFTGSGLVPTHIDSHQHLHLFPPVLRALEPLMKKYGINRMRSLNIPWADYRVADVRKTLFAFFLRCSHPTGEAPYRSADYFAGFFNSGSIDKDYLSRVFRRAKPGVTEVCFHPGADNRSIGEQYGFWKESCGWDCDWEREYKLLLDREVMDMIDTNGIAVINYNDM